MTKITDPPPPETSPAPKLSTELVVTRPVSDRRAATHYPRPERAGLNRNVVGALPRTARDIPARSADEGRGKHAAWPTIDHDGHKDEALTEDRN